MSNEITLDDILELEAHAHLLLDKARTMRLKLESRQPEKKGNGLTEVFKAQLRAHKLKTLLKMRTRMEQQKKKA